MDGLAAKAVQPGNFFGPDLRAYGFQYQGYPLGGWVAENILESGFAYFAHAQGVVAIDPAAESRLAVVEVHALEVLKAHDTAKGVKAFPAAFLSANVVTRGKHMGGIQANTDSGFILNPVNELCQLFKSVSQVGALSRGIFDDGTDAITSCQCQVD